MINLSMAEPENMLRPRITVIGVGGAGGNAINNMIRSNLEGCDFVGANTDSQALAQSLAPHKIQLGTNLSRGLGAGSKPEVGRAAAEETMSDILALLEGSDMLFVTAGMGGGTGTGAAPVIARAARESGILTVGVVTKPFHFEGTHRMRQAESGIAELQEYVDTLIVIPNQNLFRIANERTTFAEAFRMADEVLHSGVRGITDLMVMPGFMNLDFADVKTVMGEMGKAMMGTGEAEGDNRAIQAAEAAISNPLLDDISMKGARGVLINITGGLDMTLFEVDQAANRIREEVDPEAQIKVGSTLGEGLDGRIRVSVIATGIDVMLDERINGDGKAVESPETLAQKKEKLAVQQMARAAEEKPRMQPVTTARKEAAPAESIQEAKPAAKKHVSMSLEETPHAGKSTDDYFMMPAAATPQSIKTASATPKPVPRRSEEAKTEAPKVREIQAQEDERPVQVRTPSARAIPPVREIPPVQQATRQRTAPVSPMQDDDMRMTQLTTEGAEPPKKQAQSNQRAQSLFQRITGFGLVRPSEERDVGQEIDEEVERNLQSSLGIDPSDRPVLSNGDADLLDIPAFLRRQSNH